MTKAYIILAHKNASQIKNLIESLDDGSSHFFLHIDLRSNLKYEDFGLESHVNIHAVKSLNSTWGHFGLVKATLNAMTLIKQSLIKFEKIILLSGQDYPIKSNGYINDFFKNSRYSIFLDHSLIPDYNKWTTNGGLYRIDKYFLGFSSWVKFLSRIINFLTIFIRGFRRKLVKKMDHYHGSQWWTIDNNALNYILNFVADNPQYITFHKYTFAPDELFFQTILLNSNSPDIIGKILNNNNMLMKWKDEFVPHPEILTIDDFSLIKDSESLFARKFDLDKDANILKLIDQLRMAY